MNCMVVVIIASGVFVNLLSGTLSQDACSEYTHVDSCLKDSKCGWCEDSHLCIVGMGPDMIDKTNSWLTYGGDSRHSGYVATYFKKINTASKATEYFVVDPRMEPEIIDIDDENSNVYVSSVAATDETLYFSTFRITKLNRFDVNTLSVNAYSINEKKRLWDLKIEAKPGDYPFDYGSGPTISSDNKYILLLGGSTQNGAISPIVIDIDSKNISQLAR